MVPENLNNTAAATTGRSQPDHRTFPLSLCTWPGEDWRFFPEALRGVSTQIVESNATCKSTKTRKTKTRKYDAACVAVHFAHPCEKSLFQFQRTTINNKSMFVLITFSRALGTMCTTRTHRCPPDSQRGFEKKSLSESSPPMLKERSGAKLENMSQPFAVTLGGRFHLIAWV